MCDGAPQNLGKQPVGESSFYHFSITYTTNKKMASNTKHPNTTPSKNSRSSRFILLYYTLVPFLRKDN